MKKLIALISLIVLTPFLQGASAYVKTSSFAEATADKPSDRASSSSELPIAGMHTLISKDGIKIEVPAAAALKYSGFLRTLHDFDIQLSSLDDRKEVSATTDLSSLSISTEALQLLADLMSAAYTLENTTSIISSKRIAQSIRKSPSLEAVKELLNNAAEPLQLQPIIVDAIANVAIRDQQLHVSLEDLKKLSPHARSAVLTRQIDYNLKKFANLSAHARSAIAKQEYLLFPPSIIPQGWHNYQDDITFQVSIQDLIDYNKTTITTWDNMNTLKLGMQSINDLTGLSRIPRIHEVEALSLHYNNFTSLACDTFADLTNLISIDLSRNHIESIAPGTFAGLINLEKLYLMYNPISKNLEEQERILQEVKAASPNAEVLF